MMKFKSLAVIALSLFIGACSTDRSDKSDRSDMSRASTESKVITADMQFSATAYDDVVATVRSTLMDTYPGLRDLITDSRPSYGVLLVTQEKSADAVDAIIGRANSDGFIPADFRVAPEYSASTTDGEVRYMSYYLIHNPSDFIPSEPVTASESRHDGHTAIDLQFTDKDIDDWTTVTRRHIGKQLAIIVNGRVVCAPFIQSEITGGKAQITGLFDHEFYETLTKTGRKTGAR